VEFQRDDLLSKHQRSIAEVDECHVTLLVIDRERKRCGAPQALIATTVH
jgi:hypothetical protein